MARQMLSLQAACAWPALAEIALHAARRVKLGGAKNVQKKFQNLLTGTRLFAILGAHMVNT
jgi:hypothetical protein